MHDLGIKLENKNMSKKEFVKYRKIIEKDKPLAHDLNKAKLGYLPKIQMKWNLLKKNISDAYYFRSEELKLQSKG
jgi:predicted  nucleic acid-binding Zn ribbon protein